MKLVSVRTRLLACVFVALIGCSQEPIAGPIDNQTAALTLRHGGALAKLDRTLQAAYVRWAAAKRHPKWRGLANLPRLMPERLMSVRKGRFQGREAALVDVFIQTDSGPRQTASLGALSVLGARIRTVVSNGIVTATVPMERLPDIAKLAAVSRVECAPRVEKLMDISRGPTGVNVPPSLRPEGSPATGGAGVVVGLLDTGIDWNHADFRDAQGTTRVHALWDQSDYADANPPDQSPPGKTYGHVYEAADIQACIDGQGTYCVQKDIDAHGSHVLGTAAASGLAHGDGSVPYQFAGVAPEATLIVVKFDFLGPRNNALGIIDGVDWIFQRAAALNMPAVVNLSLGNDLGPHDGSTLQELGLDSLVGQGRIVVAAAGNAARNAGGRTAHLWGPPIHGSSAVPQGGCSEIAIDMPAGATGDYLFVSVWYPGSDRNRIRVITPSGATYPNAFGRWFRVWDTGTPTTYYRTSEGTISVGNGGDRLGWGSNNGDNELFVQLSDFDNASPVAKGLWRLHICDDGMAGSESEYHAWFGRSAPMLAARLLFDGKPTDNQMTVNAPGTARNLITVGAYTTRMAWQYADLYPADGTCEHSETTPCCQFYNDYPWGPQSTLDPFFMDMEGGAKGFFDYDFAKDGHPCYLDGPSDWSEPYNLLAHFSSRGPTRDDRTKPEIAAPGVGIAATLSQDTLEHHLSLPPHQSSLRWANLVTSDQKHFVLMGTSMAAPHVTGAVALLLERDANLDHTAARTILTNSARRDDYTGSEPNDDWGAGKTDVAAALAQLEPAPGCSADGGCMTHADDMCFNDVCVDGQCTAVPKDCKDTDACTTDSCDPAIGCVNAPIVCNDDNGCTSDRCHSTTGECVYEEILCPGSDACNPGSCDPDTGTCTSTPISCEDNNECTIDSCDADSGCTYEFVAAGTLCNGGAGICNDAGGCDPTCNASGSVSGSNRNAYVPIGTEPLAYGTTVSATLDCAQGAGNVDLYLQRCRNTRSPCTSWRTRRSSRRSTCSENLAHVVTRYAGRHFRWRIRHRSGGTASYCLNHTP
ncbi:MAG: S8 family serine peptidase [Proteobacteria bacterium]|nr:S8 family serine peptidase [Pseudomonadota bacterium]